MKNSFVVLAIISASILSGCVAYGEAYIPAPPPAEVEVVGVAPFPEALWIPGYWNWHREYREYRWVPGRWEGHGRGRGRGHGHGGEEWREHEYEPRR